MMAALPSSSHEKRSTNNTNTNMDEIAVVLRRFGDEQSTLLDQFERLSFEVQLNQAILRRSFSEPGGVGALSKSQPPGLLPLLKTQHHHPPSQLVMRPQTKKKRKASGFAKVLKKLLKPIFVRKGSTHNSNSNNSNSNSNSMNINNVSARNHETPDPKNPKFFKAFSRSLRL